jgi:hypothetical protein
MTRHAMREPAAIARVPLWIPGPLRERRVRAAPQECRAGLRASARSDTPASWVLKEFDAVVRKSHRRAALRRRLHSVSSAFAKLWSRMSPETPQPQTDRPPDMWFPWF